MGNARTVVVTGASRGIGLALAQAFERRGDNVVANSRRISASGTLPAGDRLALVDGDIARPETARRVVATARERFGGVDLLVNNAGIFLAKPFVEHTSADFEALVATNLAGFFHVTREALGLMRPRGAGHVVTITTSLASQPIAGVPSAVSVLTKAGLNAATKALAIEHAGEGIRFNAVAPGVVDTPMHAPENHATLKRLHPIERLGTVSEVVDAILYLDGAAFVTGEVLHVDGGAHAGKW
jgi:NAD(P)-dependent dehydrogenase (short-subunit alcohol dehydrogenase family)